MTHLVRHTIDSLHSFISKMATIVLILQMRLVNTVRVVCTDCFQVVDSFHARCSRQWWLARFQNTCGMLVYVYPLTSANLSAHILKAVKKKEVCLFV